MEKTEQKEILVVDDTPSSLQLLTGILTERGYRVRPASGGALALRSAFAKQPDLILLDVRMPDLDGFEVCSRLKADERTRNIPVLFISAAAETTDKIRGFEAGGVDYITKPFQEEEVAVRVDTQMRMRDMARGLQEAKESLERRVEERTAELAAANRVLQTEITERRHAEREMQRLSRRTELILDSAGEGIFGLDISGDYTFMNNSAAAMLGYRDGELIGTHSHTCIHFKRADGTPYPEEECRTYAAFRDGRVRHVDDECFCRKDGTFFPIEYTSTPIVEDGKITGAVVTFRDTTERRRAEDDLKRAYHLTKTIIDSVNDAISLIDVRDFTIVSVNSAFLKNYGYSDESKIAGKHCYEITHHRTEVCSPPDDICPLIETVKTKEHFAVDHVHYDRHGRSIYVEVSTSPIMDEAGNVVQVVHVQRDITDRKRAEQERERLLADIARSNKELEQFAYVASHDLQEPLRMVASYVGLLEKRYKGRLDEKADRYIDFAVHGALRMQKLIEGLLAYSRVASRGTPYKPVDLNHVFEDAVTNLSAAVRESSATVTKDRLPVVTGDETQMLQLFQNLIGNAIKFRKRDVPPEINIAAEKKGNEWTFCVRDNGIGIEAEYFDRVFQIFQRLHSQQEYTGTGIGLAVCKKIVERHGGRIWVESAPGEGTRFFFTIPASC